MKLVLRNVSGETISLDVMPGDTFHDLKTRMQQTSGIVLDLEQLKYKGKKITDDQVITQYFADDVNDLSDDATEDNAMEDLIDAPLVVACSIPGCSNSALTCPEKTFFRFPTETSRCQHWLLLCKRLDLLDKPSIYVSQRHVVCQDHFVLDQLVPTSNGLKLKYGAVPTLVDADYLIDSAMQGEDEVITDEMNIAIPIKTEPSFEYVEIDDDIVSDLEDSCEPTTHPGLLCRLCASEIGDMVESGEIVYIFSSAAKDQDIAHKINMSLPVTVKSTDPLPKQLCMQCLEKLNVCHEFAESCLQAEKKLCNMNKDRTFKAFSIEEKENATKEEIGIRSFHDSITDFNKTNDSCYSCPLCCDGNMTNPKESKESDIIGEIQKMDGVINTYHNSEESPFDNHSNHKTNPEDMFGLPTDILYRHRATHVEMKPFQCDKCGHCFSRKALFNQHALVHLNDNLPKQQRTCKLCGEVIVGAYTKMLEHRRLQHPGVEIKDEESPVTPSKPFKCEECGKSFAYRVTLVAHMRKHTGELPFECQYCEKRFSQKRSLVLHERTHTGEKPYECETCGKRFSQSAHMYSHLRLHTGEKPYSCPNCPSTFRLKDVRDAHLRKHTGERPYKCNVCEKAFRTSHSYYQHMWIHQGKKPYPCEYCGKAFRRSNGLKIHIRIHTGEKPHCCEVCGRGFAQKQDMKKHLNLHLNGSVFRKKEPVTQEVKPALMIIQ